uniref:Uncharacterized protein n=1 Tax=Romanomermis culicivorax TaxID=13658 RepID=A0A915KWW3_ROMCU
MRGVYRFSGRITVANLKNKPPKEGVYVTLQYCGTPDQYGKRCAGSAESIAWARTNKNGQWEMEKNFTGSGYSFHDFLYINFGKTECLRADQRVKPIRSEKVSVTKNDRVIH